MEYKKPKVKCELYHDSFQNFKKYGIPKAQLVIADIPYNLGTKTLTKVGKTVMASTMEKISKGIKG